MSDRMTGVEREPNRGGDRKTWLSQFLKFGLVGLFNTLIDFAVFTLLIFLSVHYAFAQAIAYLVGMANSYYMNSAFTFSSKQKPVEDRLAPTPAPIPTGTRTQKPSWRRQLRFLVWNLFMLGLTVGLIALCTEGLGLHEMLSKVFVTGFIVILNFYGSKVWVFAEPSVQPDQKVETEETS